jgi:hypothetical protein
MPRPRFSLRTLFVLVTVFCVWLGWSLYQARSRNELRISLTEQLEARGALVSIDSDESWQSRLLSGMQISGVEFGRGKAGKSYDLLLKTKAAFPGAVFWEKWQEPGMNETQCVVRSYLGKNGEFDSAFD